MKSVGVLGAGITGLSACHWIKRGPSRCRATVYERDGRVGGWIHSTTVSDATNPKVPARMLELGPRSLRAASAVDTLDLIADMGLESDIIYASDYSKVRLLVKDSKVYKLPTGLISALQSAPLREAVFTDVRLTRERCDAIRAQEGGDSSIEQFMTRHFGAAATHEIIAGVVTGIFAGNIAKLSAQSCFPAFVAKEKSHGSIIRSMIFGGRDKTARPDSELMKTLKKKGGVFSFKGGLGTLSEHLKTLHMSDLKLGNGVQSLSFDAKGNPSVTIAAGGPVETHDALIATLPAYEMGRLFKPVNSRLSSLLLEIPYIDIAVVNLVFKGDVIADDLKGFGFLVPPREKNRILGVAIDSIVFPDQTAPGAVEPETRLTVMIGGDRSCHENVPDVSVMPEEELFALSTNAVAQFLGVKSAPVLRQLKVCKRAIPQYVIGHADRVKEIESILEAEFPRVKIAGASLYGIGVNDCITSARKAVEHFQNK